MNANEDPLMKFVHDPNITVHAGSDFEHLLKRRIPEDEVSSFSFQKNAFHSSSTTILACWDDLIVGTSGEKDTLGWDYSTASFCLSTSDLELSSNLKMETATNVLAILQV